MAEALAALGNLVRNAGGPRGDARLTAVQKVAEARQLVSIAMFEAPLMDRRIRQRSYEESTVQRIDRLAAATFVVAAQPGREDIGDAARTQDAAAAQWLEDAGAHLAAGETPPAPPRASIAPTAALSPETPSSLRAAIEARAFLQREIEHAAATPV